MSLGKPLQLRVCVVLSIVAFVQLVSMLGYAGYTKYIVVNTYEQEQVHIKLQLLADQETLNLALEFGFDPLIVKITQQLARNVYGRPKCPSCLTWRQIRSDKELTIILLSLIQVESGGNHRAYNPSGASGLTQLMYATARSYDRELQPEQLFHTPKNLDIAVQYFVDLLKRYHGNTTLALLAWNRGPGTVDRYLAFGQSPENGFSKRVFNEAAVHNTQGM